VTVAKASKPPLSFFDGRPKGIRFFHIHTGFPPLPSVLSLKLLSPLPPLLQTLNCSASQKLAVGSLGYWVRSKIAVPVLLPVVRTDGFTLPTTPNTPITTTVSHRRPSSPPRQVGPQSYLFFCSRFCRILTLLNEQVPLLLLNSPLHSHLPLPNRSYWGIGKLCRTTNFKRRRSFLVDVDTIIIWSQPLTLRLPTSFL